MPALLKSIFGDFTTDVKTPFSLKAVEVKTVV